MKRLAAISVALLGISAGPPADDLVREANAVLAGGDVDGAETRYEAAAATTNDPGLVEFNLGVARVGRGDFRRAETAFRRSLSDADVPPERRARALHNLGHCLVRQAGPWDVRRLQDAIDCFDAAATETSDDGLRRDARHNLELAKLLWAKARAIRPPGSKDEKWDDPPEPPKDKKSPPPEQKQDGDPKAGPPDGKSGLEKAKESAKGPQGVKKAVPGQGSLPVIPDTAEVPSISADQARLLLEVATERLNRERQRLRSDAILGERPRANDW